MPDPELPLPKPIELRLRNYEFLFGRYLDFYRLYMQSWSIVGTGILVAGIAALVSGASDARIGIVQCILPPVLLVWFLLTSYFWSMFILFRRELADLERDMLREFGDHPGVSPSFFSGRFLALFPSGGRRRRGGASSFVAILVVVFTAPVYLLLSHGAASHLATFTRVGREVWFAAYVAGAVLTIVAIARFRGAAVRVAADAAPGREPASPGPAGGAVSAK